VTATSRAPACGPDRCLADNFDFADPAALLDEVYATFGS